MILAHRLSGKLGRLAALVFLLALLGQPAVAAAKPVGGMAAAAPPSVLFQGTPAGDPRFGLVDAYERPDAARSSGARWERVNFWWNEIQPDNATQHQPPQTISDAQLRTELGAGMTVVGLLGNPPAWATRNGSTPANLDLPITDPRNYWAAFVRWMVTTYAGRINQWIIWNEPDIPYGMVGSTWAGSVDEYYQLVKVAAQVAKGIDPSVRIIVAGTTYWVDANRHVPLFIDRFAALAAADPTAPAHGFYFDAVDLHVYSRASDVLRIAQVYRDALHSHGIDKPLWLSEANVAPYDDPTASRAPDLGHDTMAEQADFVVEAFAYALAAGIERMSIYRLLDTPTDPTGPWGLIRTDGSARPAFRAYQTAVANLAGATNVKLDRQPDHDTLVYDRGDEKAWLFWATGTPPAGGSAPLLGNAVQSVDRDGKVTTPTLPTSGVLPPLHIALSGSNSPSDDGGPRNTRVGGDPVFLVQGGIGQGIALPGGAQYFPQTGHTVGAPFLEYVVAHGGPGHFGQPTSDAHPTSDGEQGQEFERVKLRTRGVFAGSDYYIQEAGTGGDFPRAGEAPPILSVAPPPPGSDSVYFPQTGHSISGSFRRFFERHDGLRIFGYPRTEAFQQQGHLVQWFQRAQFEYHPEFAGTPFEVELRLLGSELTAGRTFPQATPPAAPNPSVVFFSETGYQVAFGFLRFFKSHGGIEVFGYPISNEIQETGAGGVSGTVQYFQRARFEYHPEFAGTPYEVELGLLGDHFLGL